MTFEDMAFQEMGFHLTMAGSVHAGLAMAGILIGLIQFLRVKATRLHRALGHGYVCGMLVADGTALLIYHFTGKFNILHLGAIANLICIIAAMVPVLQNPRPVDWKIHHYRRICGSYVGLLAAATTELVVRVIPFSTQGPAWIATAVATSIVTAIGSVLIGRHHPIAAAGKASGDLTEPV
jgi:uncharacterized membrane protein